MNIIHSVKNLGSSLAVPGTQVVGLVRMNAKVGSFILNSRLSLFDASHNLVVIMIYTISKQMKIIHSVKNLEDN